MAKKTHRKLEALISTEGKIAYYQIIDSELNGIKDEAIQDLDAIMEKVMNHFDVSLPYDADKAFETQFQALTKKYHGDHFHEFGYRLLSKRRYSKYEILPKETHNVIIGKAKEVFSRLQKLRIDALKEILPIVPYKLFEAATVEYPIRQSAIDSYLDGFLPTDDKKMFEGDDDIQWLANSYMIYLIGNAIERRIAGHFKREIYEHNKNA